MPNLAYIITLFLPAYLVYLRLGSGSISFLDVLIAFFLFFFLLYLKKEKLFSSFQKFIQSKKVPALPLFLIVAGLFLSYFFNLDPKNWQNGVGVIKSFYLLPILFALALSFLVDKKVISSSRLFGAYFISSTLIATGGFFCLFLGNLTYDNRLLLFFDSPNQLAMYLIPGILMGIYFIKSKEKTVPQEAFIILAVIVQVGILILTKSQGGYWGLLGALSFLLWPKKFIFHRNKIFYPLVLTVSGLFFMATFFITLFLSRIDYSPFVAPSSFDSRLVIYQVGTKIIRDNLFTGIGASNFQNVYLENQKYFLPYPQWAVPHPHNLFLIFLMETGILGFAGFVLLLFKMRDSFLQFKTKEDFLIGSVVIYFLLHGLVDAPFWKNDLAVIFWLFVFLSFSISKDCEKQQKTIK